MDNQFVKLAQKRILEFVPVVIKPMKLDLAFLTEFLRDRENRKIGLKYILYSQLYVAIQNHICLIGLRMKKRG